MSSSVPRASVTTKKLLHSFTCEHIEYNNTEEMTQGGIILSIFFYYFF